MDNKKQKNLNTKAKKHIKTKKQTQRQNINS